MKKRCLSAIIFLVLIAQINFVFAVPAIPTAYNGFVRVDDAVPPTSTNVTVLDVYNNTVGQDLTLSVLGVYSLNVGRETTANTTDNAVVDGETIYFWVADIFAQSRVVGGSGLPFTVNLSVADSEPPTAPSELTVWEETPGIVNLSWAPASDNIEVLSYNIYRSTETGLTKDTGDLIGNSETTAYVDDTEAADGETYYYVVTALDTSNEGDESSEENITVTDLVPPDAPTGLTVIDEPGAEGSLVISWDANAEEDFDHYILFISTDGLDFDEETQTEEITYVDGSLDEGTTYYYKVLAVDTSSNPSENSSVEANAPIDDLAPDQVTGVSAIDMPNAENMVNVTWNEATGDVTGYSYYNIYRDGALIDTVIYGELEYIDTDVTDGTEYYYNISAVDDATNEGDLSAGSIATPLDDVLPGTPVLELESAGNGVIELSWEAIEDAEAYLIFRATTSGGYTVPVNITADTTFTDYDLDTETTYFYEIAAYDSDEGVADGYNISEMSNEVSAMPSDRPVITPTEEDDSFIKSGTVLTFTISSGIALDLYEYNIYNSTDLIFSYENTTEESEIVIEVDTEGYTNEEEYIIEFIVNDTLSQETEQNFTYTIDDTTPTIFLMTANRTYTSDRTPAFRFNVTDNFENDIYCRLLAANLSWGDYYPEEYTLIEQDSEEEIIFTDLSPGTYAWNVECYDEANNSNDEAENMFTFYLDTQAPTTESNVPESWVNAPFNITLTPSDNYEIDYTNYSIDGVMFQGNRIEIDEEGNFTITFFSVDMAGNAEEENTINALLDLTPPTTESDIEDYPGWQNTNFNINLTANDDLSGIAFTNYTVDGSMAEGTAIAITTSANHTIIFFSVDIAGNIEEESTIYALLDKVAPSVSSAVLSADFGNAGDVIDITAVASEALSGLATCKAYWSTDTTYQAGDTLLKDLGTDCEGNITIPSAGQGYYYVIVRAVDNAGNSGTAYDTLGIDTTAPSITLYSPENSTYESNDILFNWSITDTRSGLYNLWYTRDSSTDKHYMDGAINSSTQTGFGTGTHTIYFSANDTMGNIAEENRIFLVSAPLNVTLELGEIENELGDILENIELFTGDTNQSSNSSLGANQTMTMEMSINSSGTDIQVEIPAFNGLDANWDSLFDIIINITGGSADNIEDNSGTNILFLTLFTNMADFLPDSAYEEGAIITINAPLGDYDVLYIEDDEGDYVYKLERCINDTAPTLINLTTMCFINSSINVTLYVPHLSGGALANDSIAPIIDFISPLNNTEINDSFTTVSLGFSEANPKDSFCGYVLTKNAATNTSGSIDNDDITWTGTSGAYDLILSLLDDANYSLEITCEDLRNQSTVEELIFSVEDVTPPSIETVTTSETGSKIITLSINITTTEESLCKYSLEDEDYDDMSDDFTDSDDGIEHTAEITFTTDDSGSYYFRCIDIADNAMNYSNSTDFDIDVESGTTSGGGSTSITSLWTSDDSIFTVINNFNLKFSVAGKDHNIKVTGITKQDVTFTVTSDPIIFTLAEGETKNVDVDSNGIYDIQVRIQKIMTDYSPLRAVVEFSRINSAVASEPEQKTEPAEIIPEGKPPVLPAEDIIKEPIDDNLAQIDKETGPQSIVIPIIAIILVLFAVGFYVFWRNRHY